MAVMEKNIEQGSQPVFGYPLVCYNESREEFHGPKDDRIDCKK